jgi:hypothetical protein
MKPEPSTPESLLPELEPLLLPELLPELELLLLPELLPELELLLLPELLPELELLLLPELELLLLELLPEPELLLLELLPELELLLPEPASEPEPLLPESDPELPPPSTVASPPSAAPSPAEASEAPEEPAPSLVLGPLPSTVASPLRGELSSWSASLPPDELEALPSAARASDPSLASRLPGSMPLEPPQPIVTATEIVRILRRNDTAASHEGKERSRLPSQSGTYVGAGRANGSPAPVDGRRAIDKAAPIAAMACAEPRACRLRVRNIVLIVGGASAKTVPLL